MIFLTGIFQLWHIEANLLVAFSKWSPRSSSLCTLVGSYKSVGSCDGSGMRSRRPHDMLCYGPQCTENNKGKKNTTLKKHTKYIPKMSGKLATELKGVEWIRNPRTFLQLKQLQLIRPERNQLELQRKRIDANAKKTFPAFTNETWQQIPCMVTWLLKFAFFLLICSFKVGKIIFDACS